jgi:hypothetical protein
VNPIDTVNAVSVTLCGSVNSRDGEKRVTLSLLRATISGSRISGPQTHRRPSRAMDACQFDDVTHDVSGKESRADSGRLSFAEHQIPKVQLKRVR